MRTKLQPRHQVASSRARPLPWSLSSSFRLASRLWRPIARQPSLPHQVKCLHPHRHARALPGGRRGTARAGPRGGGLEGRLEGPACIAGVGMGRAP